jgi:hypothetical protein
VGVGLHILGEIKPSGLFGRVRPERALPRAAEHLVAAAVRDFPALAPYVRVTPGQDGELLVHLHPADEEVRLSVHGKRLLLSARTNGAGPGYHAFLVGLMDELARAGELHWLPTVQEGEDVYRDATGYFDARDFGRLRAEMVRWLQAVAGQIVELPGGSWLLSMAIGTPLPVGAPVAIAPSGSYGHDWIRAAASGDDLAARAARFFPWWDQGVSAAAIAGTGRAALWLFPWHPPRDREEKGLAELALACGRQPGTSRELDELLTLLAATPEEAPAPRAEGFGFLRRLVRRTPYPGCTLELPGYYYEEDDTDGQAKVYWFGSRIVRVVAWLVAGGPGDGPRALVEQTIEGSGPPAATFVVDRPPLAGFCALLQPAYGEVVRHAHAVLERPGRMVLITVTYEDPADASWVETVVRSLDLQPVQGD